MYAPFNFYGRHGKVVQIKDSDKSTWQLQPCTAQMPVEEDRSTGTEWRKHGTF